MGFKTKKYSSNQIGNGPLAEVRAVKVTEKNYRDVAEWVGGEAASSHDKKTKDVFDHRVRVKTPKGIRAARVGDFVYKAADDTFYVGKDEFLNIYTLVPPVKRK